MGFEYKVVPAPARGLKAPGVKSVEDRFAHALASTMNTLAADGWEYLRAETLPCEQREGLLSKTVVVAHHMLVFRRAKAAANTAPRIKKRVPPPEPKLSGDTDDA